MYNLVIKESLDFDNPYKDRIILHDLTLDEAFNYIKEIEERDRYYYEIIRQDEE